MNKQELIEAWLRSAEENVSIAKDMYRLTHYHWALFMWHLAIEKMLKASYVKKDLDVPYIHDIRKLIKHLNLNLTDIEINENELDEITSFNMEARYEDYKHKIYKKATKEYTDKWVAICERIYTWIKNNLN